MHSLNLNAYGNELVEYDSILEALAEERIVEFKLNEEGDFDVHEKCDGFFGGTLTRQQLFELGTELQQLARESGPVTVTKTYEYQR